MTDPSPVPVEAAKRNTKKIKVFNDDVDESESDESSSAALAVFSDDGGQGILTSDIPTGLATSTKKNLLRVMMMTMTQQKLTSGSKVRFP